MKIGNITIERTAGLAPMAGAGDRAFREICIEEGAAYTVAEMASARGITYNSKKSRELLETFPSERPIAVQLFCDDPEVMARAVVMANEYSPQIIDINMGCPVPKITGSGAGSALMRDLEKARRIIRGAVSNTEVPVTVKFRKGWSDSEVTAVELALIAEEEGVSAVTVHGRTRAQQYSPPVDLEIIKRVKEAVGIPVIGNGGVRTVEELGQMYDYTGCDLVVVGHGALGRPWFFRQARAYMLDGAILPDPSITERLRLLRRQCVKAVEYKGERVAMREARTHAAAYMHGLKGAAGYRNYASGLETLEDLDRFIDVVLRNNLEE